MASTGRNRSGSLYRRWNGREYAIDDKTAMGKGVIWLRYMLNGKRQKISLKTSDVAEAQRKQQEFMAPLIYADEKQALDQLVLKATQVQQKIDQEWEANNPPLTVEQAWDAYLASHERPDSGEATLKNYSRQWNRFKKWYQGKYPDAPYMKDVSPQIASEYASDLTNAKLSPNTFNKHINLVKLVFKTLAELARMEANPFGKIKSRKLKTESKRELSGKELKTVLNSATGDLKILLYIGTFTGLRLGDCATLEWREIDMAGGLIKLSTNKTTTPIILGIPDPLYNLLNATDSSERKGYILPDIAQTYKTDESKLTNRIQAHFEGCDIKIHKEGTGYEKVPDPSGKHEYLRVYTGKRAVTVVGFHSLRHTFVSMHATLGTPQAVIQAIVGHGNPAMTSHYTHIGTAAAKQAAKLLNSGIQDADFEVIEDKTVPPWIVDKLNTMTEETWKSIRNELTNKQS